MTGDDYEALRAPELPDLDELDEGEQNKETYAWAGLALYYSQVLEHGLVNLIYVVLGTQGLLTEEDCDTDDFWDGHFKKMLGHLLKEVHSLEVLSNDAAELIARAVARRNSLVHEFFRERAELMFDQEGRQLVLMELRDTIILFMEADTAVEAVMFSFGTSVGLTPEAVRAKAEELKRASRPLR